MPRYDYVLFDADNTLFDFDGAEHAAIRLVLEEYGYPFNDETEGAYRRENKALWAAFDRGEVSLDFLLVERFRRFMAAVGGDHDPAAFNRSYLNYLGLQSAPMPGALELCRALAPHCTLALATNGVARIQEVRMETSPLAPYLSGVFISQVMGVQKPERAYFDRVLSDLGAADKSRCVMVGDGLATDILGGSNAGLDTIWYNYSGLPDPEEPRPTYTVLSLHEVGAIILDEAGEELARA